MSEKLDQATYEEVKAGQIDGAEATEIAAQLEISTNVDKKHGARAATQNGWKRASIV
jgi:hypothetical protein